jgi:O-antigen ligase
MLTPAISFRSGAPSLARARDRPHQWPAYAAAKRAQVQTATSDLPWDLLLACVAGYILTCVGRVHQLFPMLQVVRPALLTGLLAIVLYVVDQRPERRVSLVWTGTTKWMVGLLAWAVLSMPWALVIGDGFDLVFGSLIKIVVMSVVIAGTIRTIQDADRLAAVYLLGATVYAAVVLCRFDIGAGDDWRLGRLYYYDANDFATFAVTAMPFGLYFAQRGRRRRTRLLAVVSLVVLSAAFVNSGSRGGFLALVAMGAFIALRYTAVSVRVRVSALIVVGLVLLGTARERFWQQMGTIISDTDYNHTEESGRLQIWRRGVGYMLDNPVFGVGPGNFSVAEGTLSPFAERQQFGVGVRWNAPHNSFVQVGTELGVPGLVLFVGMIANAFVVLRRSGGGNGERGGPDPVPVELTQALTASLIGYVVGAFFLSLAYAELLYTLIALAVGVQKLGSRPVSGPRPPVLKVSRS